MQFALIELKDKVLHLIAAEEIHEFEKYGVDNIYDKKFDESNTLYKIGYGAFMPSNAQQISEEQAINFLQTYEDYQFGYIHEGQCINFAIKKFLPLKHENNSVHVLRRGMSWRIPFACLIETDGAFQFRNSSFARACFLRAVNVSPADNVFMRTGIVAIKSEEKRIATDAAIQPSNWEQFVHADRILSVSKSIN